MIYYTSHSTEVYHEINNTGTMEKTPFKTVESPMSTQDEVLICKNEDCGNEYIAGWESGKLFRGSKI
ncbi:hypothetical protein [Clostridium akagii]|uniref:hypothetical protein n=1 Tax=Clostridium akagii TaxID=91623 RepID=UPI00047E36CC|nr:hypothetical protein [Clostridium akagii]